jgi:hypothetical protein
VFIALGALELVEAADLAVGVVLEDQCRQLGDADLEVVAARGFVGHREQQQRRAALGLPDAFHRRHLLRLVLQRVQPVQVAGQDLQRDQHRGHRQPVRSAFGVEALALPLSSCQALTPASTKATVSPEASSTCTRR